MFFTTCFSKVDIEKWKLSLRYQLKEIKRKKENSTTPLPLGGAAIVAVKCDSKEGHLFSYL